MSQKKVQDVIKERNKGFKWKIRLRPLKNGMLSVLLDKSADDKHHCVTLDIYLKEGSAKDPHNDNNLRLVYEIQMKKDSDDISGQIGIKRNKKTKTNFIVYWDKIIKNKNYKTAEMYAGAKKYWEKLYGKDLSIEEITSNHIKAYLSSIKHLSQTTQHHYLFAIRHCLKEAILDEIIANNPASRFSIKQDECLIKYLSEDEVKAIASVQGNEIRDPFLFSCFTGLRLSDVRNLKWSDMKNNTIYIKQDKTKEPVGIQLSDDAEILLEANKNNGKYVFSVPTNRMVQYRMKILIQSAGIKEHIHFHCSRHTFATTLLNEGNSIEVVSKLMGHKDIKTTQRYAKIINKTKQDAIAKMPKILNISKRKN